MACLNLIPSCQVFLYLFIWVLTSLSTFCIVHITIGGFMCRGNQYIQLVMVLYCKLPINSKQLPAFPLEVGPGFKIWSQRVWPICHHAPPTPTPTPAPHLVKWAVIKKNYINDPRYGNNTLSKKKSLFNFYQYFGLIIYSWTCLTRTVLRLFRRVNDQVTIGPYLLRIAQLC